MIGIATWKVLEVIELGHELDAAESDFDDYVENLTEDEQAALVALMWVGRGSFDSDDWEDALNTAMTEASHPTAEYLKGTPHFADHLESGLDEMGLSEADDEDEEEDDLLATGDEDEE
ncbi:DUF3775 domain-containing protein [Wenxinia marina]|uniref:DUF3775 domain-containing protein n=1 Tax=Wenxinia marina DSM 24838 TaxID=1123501 RepID=A0A0D0PIZ2_9RHOB|nr:DUF3775 domain-containing protein [Wenxinia marina]KIQ71366.1 hypothetical protein Wenmar_00144 [Wenxinia marina DSM 24838]GGL81291.1 hypothetical protein GCM10011392_39870 [Wenxinia marina]